jgi:hypothetical protein
MPQKSHPLWAHRPPAGAQLIVRTTGALLGAVVVTVLLTPIADRANATPLFREQTGKHCEYCHSEAPSGRSAPLNSTGRDFMDNGYKLPAGDRDREDRDRADRDRRDREDRDRADRDRRDREDRDRRDRDRADRDRRDRDRDRRDICGWYAIAHCSTRRGEADRELRRLESCCDVRPRPKVINTDNFPNFRPGYYCVVVGPSSESAARNHMDDVKRDFRSAYVKNSC